MAKSSGATRSSGAVSNVSKVHGNVSDFSNYLQTQKSSGAVGLLINETVNKIASDMSKLTSYPLDTYTNTNNFDSELDKVINNARSDIRSQIEYLERRRDEPYIVGNAKRTHQSAIDALQSLYRDIDDARSRGRLQPITESLIKLQENYIKKNKW